MSVRGRGREGEREREREREGERGREGEGERERERGGERGKKHKSLNLLFLNSELTSSGHPKMENGSRPEENHVSNTSSSKNSEYCIYANKTEDLISTRKFAF